MKYVVRNSNEVDPEHSESFAVEERTDDGGFTNNICWFSGPSAKLYAALYAEWMSTYSTDHLLDKT